MGERWKLVRWIAYALYLFLFVEAALQIFYFATAGAPLFTRVVRPIFAPDEHSGYRLKPNLAFEHKTSEFRVDYYTNSRGLRVSERVEEYPLGANPEAARILFLGPSFAFGWGVDYEDSVSARLESLLGERDGAREREVEVINAGVPALGPRPQMSWYQNEGYKYEPELVVQLVYGSMVRSKKEGRRTVDEKGYLRGNLREGGRIRSVLKNSASAFYAYFIYTRFLASAETVDNGIEGAGRRLEVMTRFDLEDPLVQWGLDYYETMAESVRSRGSSFLVVYTPLSFVVHPEDVSRWKNQGAIDIAEQVAFDRAFCRYLSEHDIPCLNLTPDLVRTAEESDERLYFWLDVHWTARGNEVAAQALAAYLAERDFGSGAFEPLPESRLSAQ